VAGDSIIERAKVTLAHALLRRRKALVHRVRKLRGTASERRYVFVAGMQRSGTNMMMDLLERSLETDVYHERDPRAFDNYQMRARHIVRRLADRSPASVFVIKALCELQELRSLLDEFAPGRAIWVVRDYEDVVNSMLVSFRNQAKQVQRIVRDRDGSGWLGRGMSDHTHALVCRLVHPALEDASAAALQWYFRNILFFEQGLDRDPRVLLVEYEAMVSEPSYNVRLVCDFLGLDYTSALGAGVFATSIRRRKPPSIDPRIREQCDGLRERIRKVATARHGARGA
jgi:hypothetical protein